VSLHSLSTVETVLRDARSYAYRLTLMTQVRKETLVTKFATHTDQTLSLQARGPRLTSIALMNKTDTVGGVGPRFCSFGMRFPGLRRLSSFMNCTTSNAAHTSRTRVVTDAGPVKTSPVWRCR